MLRDPHADDMETEEYGDWLAIQPAIDQSAFGGGDLAVLTAEVEAILARFKLPLVRSQALDMLGMAHEQRGDPERALALYKQAHELTAPGSYARYVCESCSLASVSRKLGDHAGAREWLVTALRTGIQFRYQSCSTALKGLLDLVGDERELSDAELELCRAAVVHSFGVFDQEAPPGITIAEAIPVLSRLESDDG